MLQYLVQEPRAHDDIQDDAVDEVLPVPATAFAVNLAPKDHENSEKKESDHQNNALDEPDLPADNSVESIGGASLNSEVVDDEIEVITHTDDSKDDTGTCHTVKIVLDNYNISMDLGKIAETYN